jgi:hypothetical protein
MYFCLSLERIRGRPEALQNRTGSADFSSSSLFAQFFKVENQGDLPEITSREDRTPRDVEKRRHNHW